MDFKFVVCLCFIGFLWIIIQKASKLSEKSITTTKSQLKMYLIFVPLFTLLVDIFANSLKSFSVCDSSNGLY